MGRKKAIKKKMNGISRGEVFKILRDSDTKETVVLSNGSEVIINPLKHLLMNQKYDNGEMNKYLADVVKQYKSFIKQVKEEEAAKSAEPSYEIVKEEEQISETLLGN